METSDSHSIPLRIGKNLESMMNIETLFANWNWDFQQLEPSGEVSGKLSKCSVVQNRSKINRSGCGMTQYKSGRHVKFYIFTDVPHTHTRLDGNRNTYCSRARPTVQMTPSGIDHHRSNNRKQYHDILNYTDYTHTYSNILKQILYFLSLPSTSKD